MDSPSPLWQMYKYEGFPGEYMVLSICEHFGSHIVIFRLSGGSSTSQTKYAEWNVSPSPFNCMDSLFSLSVL